MTSLKAVARDRFLSLLRKAAKQELPPGQPDHDRSVEVEHITDSAHTVAAVRCLLLQNRSPCEHTSFLVGLLSSTLAIPRAAEWYKIP